MLPDGRTSLSAAACYYASLGWPVLQLVEEGKVPATAHGLTDATCDVAAVAELWRRRPRANIGLRIPEGLVVVDVDGPEGVEALRAGGPLPRTLTASTARGWHLWFQAPGGVTLRQRAAVLPGVDTRTAGRGYVVAPPSIHETGVVYTWARRVWPAPLPQWLIDLLAESAVIPPAYSAPLVGVADQDRRRRYALAALLGEAADVASTPAGSRNHRLFAAWARCTRDPDVAPFVGRGLVRAELTRAALAAGLPAGEVARTLRDEVAA